MPLSSSRFEACVGVAWLKLGSVHVSLWMRGHVPVNLSPVAAASTLELTQTPSSVGTENSVVRSGIGELLD
jgi:hypothetical protein